MQTLLVQDEKESKTLLRRRRELQDYSSYFSSKAGVTDSGVVQALLQLCCMV